MQANKSLHRDAVWPFDFDGFIFFHVSFGLCDGLPGAGELETLGLARS
jgi:hypothetical protein